MKNVHVTAFPYATQSGTISVPDNLKTEEEIKAYISDHWNNIDFSEAELDYCGTDYDIDVEE